MKLWDSLEQKGRYATIIGFLLGIITTGIFTFKVIADGDFQYLPFALGFGFSLGFFILPSTITAKFKDFLLEIKD